MKNNNGITMITLVITIIILLILAGVSIGTGNNIIKQSNLENIKTNMLLIKVKAKEYVENANFKLGTNFETSADKENRIISAKEELKGEEIKDISIFNENIDINQDQLTTDNSNYIYYYKLTTENLVNIGLSNVKSDEKNGYYIVKYNLKDSTIEIYNTKGFDDEGNVVYSLTDIKQVRLK